jgi:hypothetical protein
MYLVRSVLVVTLAAAAASSAPLAAQRRSAALDCQAAGPTARLAELPEASGIAVSRRVPGRLWTHNDSGRPVLFALDASGAVTGRLTVTGAAVDDWEAVAVGACPAGWCIYIGDIGDNDGRRDRITVYRVPEPNAATGSAAVDGVFHATYPDGPRDAETLLIAADGRVHVVSKGGKQGIAVYRFPRELRSGSTMPLERVGGLQPIRGGAARITDGAIAPDGERVVLRTNEAMTIYRAADLLSGNWKAIGRVDLRQLREPQGEAVAFGAGDTIYVAGEGGSGARAGTFAALTCR